MKLLQSQECCHLPLPVDNLNGKALRRHFFTRMLIALACLTLTVQLLAEAPAPVPGAFTLAVIPDTQFYSAKFPATYEAQTRWIAGNAKRYNMAYVLHVGDMTDHNTNSEWQVVQRAHSLLDETLPYAIVPGNHDLGADGKTKSRDSLLSEFFPVSKFRQWPTFGGNYDKETERSENSFHKFTANGRSWLILALEFAPRHDVLRWANQVAQQHPDHSIIMITHAYLRPDNTRYNRQVTVKSTGKSAGLDGSGLSKSPEGFNDGEDMWQKLVSQHANFALVISGHVCVTGKLESEGKAGNVVHQMLVDYQNQPNGGDGYLRLLQFHPDGRKVTVNDYSPTLDKVSEIAGANYEFSIAPPVKK
jgi:3',5'-cyclic AMP phosphodiesterase CpdA